LHFVVEVKELGVVLLDLGGSVDACLTLHGVELSLDWPVQEEVGLHLFLVLDGLVPQGFHEGFGLDGEVFSAIERPWRCDFESSIEIDFLHRRSSYSFLFPGRFFGLFDGRRLNVVLVFDYGSVGIASDYSGVVHEIGAIEPGFFPVLGLDCGDFGLGCKVKLRSCLFH
jgi:hypothetical protein